MGRYTRKRTTDDKYVVVPVFSMVFLFTADMKFLNVWHRDNVARAKPGTLNIKER